jgi:rhodanese-related sulfurtransferase
MRTRTAWTVAFLALLAAGCTRKTSDRDVQFMTPAQALARSGEDPGLFGKERKPVWIDPRTPEKYAECHIAGAISLPFQRMSAEASVVLRGYDMFFVYGSAWDDTIAKAASKRLMELGFDDVYTLEGGLENWKRDGQPVIPPVAETPKDAPKPGTKTAPKAPAKSATGAAPATAPNPPATTQPAPATQAPPAKTP